MKCFHCNGQGEIEHPAYLELDELWLKGWLFDEESISSFWADRGFNPANPPLRYNACADCGGTGDWQVHSNPALEARALAAWRAEGHNLVDRLVALHQKNSELAHTLARHIERYYGLGDGFAADVASWPALAGQCSSCSGSGALGDDIPCGRCEGKGVR